MDNNKRYMNSETMTHINGGLKAEQVSSPQVAEPGNPPSFTDIFANQYHRTDGQVVDNNAAVKTSFPEIKIQPISDEDMNSVLGPVFAEAKNQLSRLEDKPENADMIGRYQRVIDASQKWDAYMTQQNQQAQIEAQQKAEDDRLVSEAETLVSSVDETTNLVDVISKVEDIMRKMHLSDALFGLMIKLQNLKVKQAEKATV